MKKIIAFITTFLCLNLAAINPSVYGYSDMASQSDFYVKNFKVNEISYAFPLKNSKTTATVYDIQNKSSVVTIPSTVENGGKSYTVKYLNFSPMENGVPLCLKTCEELNIPDTMICWDDNLGGEESNVFRWKKLKKVNISENLQLVKLSSGFADCKYLKSFTIPKNLKVLDGLTNCPKLKIKNIKICKGNKYFKAKGQFLLSSKGNKLNNYFGNSKSVKIPNGIKEIKSQVFKNKKSIRKITLSKNIKTVGYWAFRDCKNLSKVIIKNAKKSPKFSDDCFKYTKNGIGFYVQNKKVAKQFKKQLKNCGVKNAKILIGKDVVYQYING